MIPNQHVVSQTIRVHRHVTGVFLVGKRVTIPYPLSSLSALDPAVNKLSANVMKYLTEPTHKVGGLFYLNS